MFNLLKKKQNWLGTEVGVEVVVIFGMAARIRRREIRPLDTADMVLVDRRNHKVATVCSDSRRGGKAGFG